MPATVLQWHLRSQFETESVILAFSLVVKLAIRRESPPEIASDFQAVTLTIKFGEQVI